MHRRAFFAAFPALVTTTAAPVAPTRALVDAAPVCPVCGLAVLVDQRLTPGVIVTARCYCGWVGTHALQSATRP